MGKTIAKFRRCDEIKEKYISLIIFDMVRTLGKFRRYNGIKKNEH